LTEEALAVVLSQITWGEAKHSFALFHPRGAFYFCDNYTIASVESFNEESLVITGDQGYPDYLRIDVKFIAPQYLACATHFDGEVLWRIASEEEAKLAR
jgi:hypothetical protein